MEPDVSIVIPCLDEAESIAGCVEEALIALRRTGLETEVIVVDNGSRDGSGPLALGSSTSRGAATATPTSPASPPPADAMW